MSQWRREAIKQLPEYHKLITSEDVADLWALWYELSQEFDSLCAKPDPPIDLLRRIWGYCNWCLNLKNADVYTATAISFCEGLLSSPATARMLPRIISERRFLELRGLLLYHNSEEDVDRWHRELWSQETRAGVRASKRKPGELRQD